MKASSFQKQISKKLNFQIDESSFDIAAAQIMDFVEPALDIELISKKTSTEKQRKYAKSLGIDVSQDSIRVASIKISIALDKRNHDLIHIYGLKPGKQIKWKKWNRIMEISSISVNCRLWFKGGNGWGAFPHEIEPIE